MSESPLEPARGQRLLFACKLLLFATLGIVLSWEGARGLLDPARRNDGEVLAAAAVLAVLAVGALLASVRSAVALGQASPHLRFDRRGIHLRVWRERWADAWRWCPRWTERLIPWEEFRGCSVRSRNGWDALVLCYVAEGMQTKSVSFSPYLFDHRRGEIMTAILNYHEVILPQLRASTDAGVAPRGIEAAPPSHGDAFLDVMRSRFHVPRRVQGAGPAMPAMILLLGVAILVAGFVMLFAGASERMEKWSWGPLIAGLLLCLGGGHVAGSRWGNRGQRCLEFQANGFGVGPSFSRLNYFPWESFGTARLIVSYRLDHEGAKMDEGLPERLEIALKDGSTLVLPDGYHCSLEELCAWFLP